MKTTRSRLVLIVANAMLCLTVWLPLQASGQVYPDRPIKLIVPVGPGSNSDIVSRLLGEKLALSLGQPIVIENKPGAGGNIGADFVAKALPDGYTMLFASNATHAANSAIYKSLPYDPLNDFIHLAFIDWTPMLVVARPDGKYRTMEALIAASRANSVPINVAIPSTSSRVVLAEINRIAGTKFESVLYKTSGAAKGDLLGGHIDVLIDTVGASLPMMRSGTVKALAISMGERSEAFPDIPTLAESGAPGFSVSPWNIIAVPKGTPQPVVDLLAQKIRAVIADPAVQKKLLDDNGLLFGKDVSMSPPQVRAFVASELQKWDRIIRAANMQE
mgnify:CR=1 FL=1